MAVRLPKVVVARRFDARGRFASQAMLTWIESSVDSRDDPILIIVSRRELRVQANRCKAETKGRSVEEVKKYAILLLAATTPVPLFSSDFV